MSEINFRRHKERDLRFFNDAIEYFEIVLELIPDNAFTKLEIERLKEIK